MNLSDGACDVFILNGCYFIGSSLKDSGIAVFLSKDFSFELFFILEFLSI